MVAFNFQPIFVPQIAAGIKCQTMRPHSIRNWGLIGRPLQLYTGMGTKRCRRILAHDVTCVALDTVSITISRLIDERIASIVLHGRRVLRKAEIEEFARADGFAPERLYAPGLAGFEKSARRLMGEFLLQHHGEGHFYGVIIRWEPGR
jgi:hypothetical protein